MSPRMAKDRANFEASIYGDIEVAADDALAYGWIIADPKCRVCGTRVERKDFEVYFTYWTFPGVGPRWCCAHRDCVKAGYAQEAYECQCIDADCNDCKHFDRPNSHCRKLDKPTKANPGQATCHPCFEHRRNHD